MNLARFSNDWQHAALRAGSVLVRQVGVACCQSFEKRADAFYQSSRSILRPMIQSFSLSAARATLLAITATAMLLAGCSSRHTPNDLSKNALLNQPGQNLAALHQYKLALAQCIQQSNTAIASRGRPQRMLRSVVVLVFKVDKQGKLLASSVYRTNGDKRAEKIALASLRQAAPLPLPPASILNHKGEAEVLEGWLFNDDGRFQLNSIAGPQTRR